VNVLGMINPGNFGTFEGGNVLIARLFGLTAADGLALGLARRLRAFFWAAIGVMCLFILMRSRNSKKLESQEGVMDITEGDPSEEPASRSSVPAAGKFVAAIFLTRGRSDRGKFKPALARVGSLPILLRNILMLQKLEPARILVIADPILKSLVQRDL